MEIIKLEEIKQQLEESIELINSIIDKDLNENETIINNCILLIDVKKVIARITHIIDYNNLMKNERIIHKAIKDFINNDLKVKPSEKLKNLVYYIENKFMFSDNEKIYINNFDD